MKATAKLVIVLTTLLTAVSTGQASAGEATPSSRTSVTYEVRKNDTVRTPPAPTLQAAAGPRSTSPRAKKRFPVESIAQYKQRLALSRKFAQARRHPTPFLYPPFQNTIDFCRQDTAAAQPKGQVIDHLNYCQVAYISLLKRQCNSDGDCKVVGQTDFRMATLGVPKKGQRQMEFVTWLDNFVNVSGEDMSELVLSVDMRCIPQRQEGCGGIPGTVNGASSTIAAWRQNGETYFGFDSPETGVTTGTDRVSWYDFETTFTLSGQDTYTVPGDGFRCDSASYVGSSKGCVFDNTVDTWLLEATPQMKQTAAHIDMAQKHPEITVPVVANKVIPGNPYGGSASQSLSRLKATDPLYNANRGRARTECRRAWGGSYSRNGAFDCDEYPFASTYQGGASGSSQQPKNFSVRVLDSDDNQAAGRDLNIFYTTYRIIDSDPFWVSVIPDSANTPIPALPGPPVHPSNGGDLNNDGNPDLIVAGTDGQLWFYAGKGDGTVAPKKNIGTGGWSKLLISHRGDWTGDGNEDVLAQDPNNGVVYVYPGKGDGTLGARVTMKGMPGPVADPSLPHRAFLSIGDLTNKGYPDAAEIYVYRTVEALNLNVGNPADKPGIASAKNLGEGGWADYTIAAPGDADYSGRVDLLARNTSTGVFYFYPGTTSATFGSRTVFGASGWTPQNRPLITSGNDADSDGKPDLWATTGDGKLLFYSGGYDSAGHPVAGPSTVVGASGWQSMASIN